MLTGIIILMVLVVLFCLVLLAMWLKGKQIDKQYPDTRKTVAVSKDDNFQTILKKFNVPAEHYKIVISQARTYNVVNCPAVIWKAEDKIKVLVLKSNPFIAEEEWEDFLDNYVEYSWQEITRAEYIAWCENWNYTPATEEQVAKEVGE